MNALYFLAWLLALAIPTELLAQDSRLEKIKDTVPVKLSYFKVSGGYLSDAVYSGRKDSARVPYLKAGISYIDKSGFHAEVEGNILTAASEAARLDLITTGIGYSFKLSGKLEGEASATKFFYTDASFAVQSELKAMTDLSLGYDAGIVSMNGGIELLFSNATDVITNFKLSHYFETGAPDHLWTITPAVEMNAGTQRFNQAYYANRKFSFATTGNSGNSSNGNHGKGHSTTNTTTTTKTLVFTSGNKFTILDYEISTPLTYEAKRFGAFITPTYAIPTNPSEYLLDNKLQKESLSNSFFIELGGFLKLNVHHKRS